MNSPLSPLKPRYGDRFIPSRAGNTWHLTYPTSPSSTSSDGGRPTTPYKKARETSENNKDGSVVYSCLLKNEVLGYQYEDNKDISSTEKKSNASRKLFHFDASERSVVVNEPWSPYSLSPISNKSEKLLRSPKKPTRRISKVPFKVLDAPELQDDFYLNLVDWSSQNVLSVGLGTCVYLWSACTSQVTRLCDLAQTEDTVTSVAWNERGSLVAVGTQQGLVQVWDATAGKQVSTLHGHTARVGAIAWNGDLLSSGSRDRFINQKDIRAPPAIPERQLVGHRQEVCGLKWSPDNQYLASGGNDNRLYVWNLHSTAPIQNYTEHLAAVKAIAWSPHHHGLLASGGGTADRCIRFWNTLTGQPMQCIDTGSQVCNLAWSKHSSELVSTHGYSQNQILVWKYPSLQQVAKLTGHSYRVLYLAMSPDGEAIVTGAGDETLRFWNVFSKNRSQKENKSSLNLYNSIR
ncbi:Fizzy-related protein [Orchesella cincta]|uniref:Fizzy-related protein homolog n=1 Tax=Orchesella cincta TaxID=48709 RepID=A0A1D2N3Y1_ORCCI|nr:Fizzy-related protein [Orchesella cincta]